MSLPSSPPCCAIVILAGGIGSRYGGEKQSDSFHDDGAWLMDYSLYDAWQAGVSDCVIVCHPLREETLKTHLLSRWEAGIRFHFAPQDPLERKKPWGTAHATLSACAKLPDMPFITINADDFYGKNAYNTLFSFLTHPSRKARQWGMVSYTLQDTLSDAGHVSRGVCHTDKDGFLTHIEETPHIAKDSPPSLLHQQGSMNAWGFDTHICALLQKEWTHFYATHRKDKQKEWFLPYVVLHAVQTQQASVKVFPVGKNWCGVTYAEDKKTTQDKLQTLHQQGHYPHILKIP